MESTPTAPVADRFEYSFRWDGAEHRRFYRALQRQARRRRRWAWLGLKIWMGAFAVIVAVSALGARGEVSVATLWPLAIFVASLALDRWGLPYFSARAYARDHAPCLPNPQVRILDREGITAACTTMKATVRWDGIVRQEESPEFFLFFTTPACAISLPKRAVDDVPRLRAWLHAQAAGKGLAALRIDRSQR
jgi:hypothetical protein